MVEFADMKYMQQSLERMKKRQKREAQIWKYFFKTLGQTENVEISRPNS